jgi:hypothetical protein
VFLVNSRYPLVCATLASSRRKAFHQQGSSFSRSYGCNLPSSLTIVLPIALVFSTRPPVSVWGTGTVPTHCWAFLGSMESVASTETSRYHISELTAPTLIGTLLHAYPGTTIAPAHLSSCVPRQLPASRSVRSLPEGNSPHVATLGPGAGTVVLEYQPVVHRLRLSASP